MSKQILIKRYETHNCVENCIANLCDYYKIDFRPLFLFSWGFGFKTNEPILENNIHFSSEFDLCINNYYQIANLYFNMFFIPIDNDISDIELDFVVLGMGEKPIIDVLTAVIKDSKCIEPIIQDHPNIVTRLDQVEKIPCNTQICQLEWPVRNQRKTKNEISFSLITKHGCLGHCSFCSIR